MDDRPANSHVRNNGMAKVSYHRQQDAAQVADLLWQRTGRETGVYLCSQRPDHWHVGSGTPDLKLKENQ